MNVLLAALATQRWDDHRYYHHSTVNQALHLVSAISFLCCYVLLFIDPVAAALVGWFVAMGTRQAGHFFFEPKGYDAINQATHQHKEEIKVGYNLRRKIILLSVWAATPVLLLLEPALFGIFTPATSSSEFLHQTALCWIALGGAALLFRTVQLFFLQDVTTGLIWLTKIITDPVHDIYLYHRAPLYLLRGIWLDPEGPPRKA